MSSFNSDNTEGFTQDQLDVLNEVLERLCTDLPDLEEADLCDVISNAWVQNEALNTADLLLERARSNF